MEGRLHRWFGSVAAIAAPPLDAPLAGLDHLRRLGLRLLGPFLSRSLLTDRERRVSVLGSVLIVTAFFLTASFPVVMLVLGPLVWGIPHVIADVRYLVARPGLHRRPLVLAAIGVGILGAGLGFGVRGGLVGAALALCVARASWSRRLLGLGVVGALFAAAQRAGWLADLAFAHLHNLVAVVIWWAWRPRKTRLHLVPIALFAAGTALLLVGAAEPLLAWSRGAEAPWTGLGMRYLSWSLSPKPTGPLAERLVVLYAFAQATHYIVWLRLMPEDDRPSKTPRSYRQSFRALAGDIGGLILWLSAIGALALIVWAFFGPGAARDGYLRLAFFHGHLELAAGALLWAEGRRAWSPPEAAA
ncbi:hypothetical protein [Polyangium sp. 6x1]|uniref:hypothetical protein n=1 Tax=Polyangium sp. 6x1 TaxID=3042689 RepID=UPI0024832B5F|nr:hypothetical protein [Polyangium sp. 6x1]MDI1445337.1 hypothetical protein [Polyangium sp. 6x1]